MASGVLTHSDLTMKTVLSLSHQLGVLEGKYAPFGPWLETKPLKITPSLFRTVRSFLVDLQSLRSQELLLDRELLQESEGSEALKMRCCVIETSDRVLDPLIEKMERSKSFQSLLSNLPCSVAPKKPPLKKVAKEKHLPHQEKKPEHPLTKAVASLRASHPVAPKLPSTTKEVFQQCIALSQEASEARTALLLKSLEVSTAAVGNQWMWESLRAAYPLLKTLAESYQRITQESVEQEEASEEELDPPCFPEDMEAFLLEQPPEFQKQVHRAFALRFGKLRSNQTPKRSWGKAHCLDSDKVEILQEIIIEMKLLTQESE